MENEPLEKKTTILLTESLYRHLTRLARERHTSLGGLVREACEAQYGHVGAAERRKAVEDLRRLSLPVGTPRQMKRESVPDADDLLP